MKRLRQLDLRIRLRNWLLKCLAGDDSIVINANIHGEVTVLPGNSYLCNVRTSNIKFAYSLLPPLHVSESRFGGSQDHFVKTTRKP